MLSAGGSLIRSIMVLVGADSDQKSGNKRGTNSRQNEVIMINPVQVDMGGATGAEGLFQMLQASIESDKGGLVG